MAGSSAIRAHLAHRQRPARIERHRAPGHPRELARAVPERCAQREDFTRINLLEALQNRLTWMQTQHLETLAPAKLDVPSGSRIKLEYAPDGSPPVLAVRLQEVFGWLETPFVNDGRTPVLMHLLSPAYRPVQVTQDLRSFWQNTYPVVRKELKIRYPKHAWPENPWTAEAVRGVKRKT
ncbi:MAG: ATP-dependent helicase hrpB [Pleurocapsa sp. SU_196_0]|nr:ATP-dependent helicase hrpB [Pleurocapsa sp. SU_196_0]